MDAVRFDRLARSLAAAGSRRGLLALLTALPLGGSFVAFLDDEAAGKRRRARRKGRQANRRNTRQKAKDRKQRKRGQKKVALCQDGQAIRVKRKRAKKRLRQGATRGSCACTPTTCAAQGKDCGTLAIGCGQTVNCGDCPLPNQPCANNVCGVCVPDCNDKPCGTDNDDCGGPCLTGSCPAPDTCGGGGQAGVCGCTPSGACPVGANCGTVADGCGGTISCGGPCGGATPVCHDNVCTCGDVCGSGCQFTTVQAAIAAVPAGGTATIQLCAETYPRPGDANVASIVGKNLTLLGAGAELTILDGGQVSSGHSVIFANQTESALRQLTVTGALDTTGIFLGGEAILTLANVTVRDNDNDDSGGGITNNEGTVILDAGASVRDNHADSNGGGIYNNGGMVTLHDGASVSGNEAANIGGGIYNNSGMVTLHDGASVSGNEAAANGGGIFTNVGGAVTLHAGASVSGNESAANGGGIVNVGGTVTLHAGASVSGNEAAFHGGGIALIIGGTVTLETESLVCGNTPDQCFGFTDPNDACQATCPP